MAEWSVVKTPKIPDIFENVRPIVDNIFATLNIFLTFLNNVLEFVKAFLIDFSNPLLLLLKELIALIKNLISDFQNLGIYLTTDLDLIPKVFDDGYKVFAGGYSAFEQRMVNKFTNPADTTRPVISKDSAVLAIFQFAGANTEGIFAVIRAFIQLRKLFTGILQDTGLPVPSGVNATLVTKFGIPFNNSKMKAPEGLKITWELSPPANSQDSFFPSFVVPPDAFLINITTMPVQVGLLRRTKSAQTSTNIELAREIASTLYKSVSVNNKSFTLYGSPNLIQSNRVLPYADNMDAIILEGNPSNYQYFFKDDKVVLTQALVEKTNKTFYYNPFALGAFLTGNSYSLTIPLDQLPKKITYSSQPYEVDGDTTNGITILDKVTESDAEDLYIEVLSLSKDLGLSDGDVVENKSLYTWNSVVSFGLTTDTVSITPSRSGIKMPKYDRVDYINALKEALAIFILGDYLNEKNYLNGQQPGVSSAEFAKPFLYGSDKFYFFNLPSQVRFNLMAYANRSASATSLVKFDQDASDFRSDVLAVIQNIINRIPFPTLSQLDALKDTIEYLSQKRIEVVVDGNIEKKSFYDFLNEDSMYGVHANVNNFGSFGDSSFDLAISANKVSRSRTAGNTLLYLTSGLERRIEPVFPTAYTEKKLGVSDKEQVKTISKLSIMYDLVNQDMITNARRMLSALPQKVLNETGAWYNVKFFIDGFPDFTAYLNEIVAFVENLTLGLEGLIRAIKDFIEVLQKRIQEIQRIIAKLKAFIDAILNFTLDLGATVGMLFVTSQGTDGVLSDFLSSTKKPEAPSLGMGQCVVIPGPPQIIIDLFSAIFGG
jgi:hypothetical protein